MLHIYATDVACVKALYTYDVRPTHPTPKQTLLLRKELSREREALECDRAIADADYPRPPSTVAVSGGSLSRIADFLYLNKATEQGQRTKHLEYLSSVRTAVRTWTTVDKQ